MTTKHCKYRRDELESYCKDKYGYVKCVKQSMHIGLPPWGLTKIKETVRDTVLEEKFGHFDAKLGGIVLDIRNITILGDNYPVHNDSSAVHVSLNVNFYVFQPREGVIVKGIIKHIAFHHISVTIHRFFNVSIPLEKKNNNLKIDMEVDVRLTKLDFEDSIPYFEGELELPIGHKKKENSTDSGICTTNGTKVKLIKGSNEDITSDSDDDSSSDSNNSGDSLSHSDEVDFTKIKIKSEPVSSSKSFSSSDSDSDDKPTNTGFSGELPLVKMAIKREIISSASSSSDAEDLMQNVKSIKLSSSPNNIRKRKVQSHQDERTAAKIKREMSNLSSDEIDSTKRLTVSNTQNGTIWPEKKVKKEKPSSASHEMHLTQSQEVKNIQDELIFSAEKVKRKKSLVNTPINETISSPGRHSPIMKKHKRKSKDDPSASTYNTETRPKKVRDIQEDVMSPVKVKKEKSLSADTSNDESNFVPILSSTLLKKKDKKKPSEETSNVINSQKLSNNRMEPIVPVKKEMPLSSSSSADENYLSPDISSKRNKKSSKVKANLKELLRNENKT